MAVNRRNFLRLTGAGLALGAAAPLLRFPYFKRSLHAAMLGGTPAKKLIVIFLRGGMDGVNALIPDGDEDYNDQTGSRPTLYIPPSQSLDLGNDFARANPGLAKLVNDVPQSNVAYIHRVAYTPSYFSLSHFDGQQYWENAYPGYPNLEEGWINNLCRFGPGISESDFPAASVAYNLQVAFRGPKALAHIPDLATYTIGTTNYDEKLLGVAPSGDLGSGLVGVFSREADSSAYDGLVRENGLALATSLAALRDADVDQSSYVPAGGATYPSSSAMGDFTNDYQAFDFFRKLRHSVQLLKETDCRVAGIQLDGFDTHSNQDMQLERLLRILAHGFSAVYNDTETSIWDDLVIMTVSEFGRTSAENGSFGTDHAVASCMFIAGGPVNGGVYNCSSSTWGNGGMFSTSDGRYVSQRTDFRSIYAEIVDRHFGATDELDDIIPGWSSLSGSSYNYLNIL